MYRHPKAPLCIPNASLTPLNVHGGYYFLFLLLLLLKRLIMRTLLFTTSISRLYIIDAVFVWRNTLNSGYRDNKFENLFLLYKSITANMASLWLGLSAWLLLNSSCCFEAAMLLCQILCVLTCDSSQIGDLNLCHTLLYCWWRRLIVILITTILCMLHWSSLEFQWRLSL